MTVSVKAPTSTTGSIQLNGSDVLTIDSSGNLTVPNNLSVTGTAPIPDYLSTASGSAPSYSARAWVNFNGTGTVAIRNSGNVSSITDNGTGDYSVNLTIAMPDANYSVVTTAMASGSINFQSPLKATVSTTLFDIYTSNGTTFTDSLHVCAAIFR